MSENAKERDFWSGPSGRSWITHEARQDALLASVADLVIAEARIATGERVVDIGCGTGAVSELAAEAVGPEGHVLALDISEPLLLRATERLAALPQVATHLGDAASVDWSDPRFDVAVSRFGVMFFADPVRAFANIAKGLVPGGRVVFAAWAPAVENPLWHLAAVAATERLGKLPPVPPNAPGPMGLSSLDHAHSVLEQSGFDAFAVTPTAVTLSYPHAAEDLADLMVSVGAATRIINAFKASEAEIADIRDGILGRLMPYVSGDGGVDLPALINLITARVPE